MKPGDRAYFEDNKIVVMAVDTDEDTGIESTRTLGTIPYIENMDLFADFETALEKAVKSGLPEKVCVIDGAVLRKLVEQFKAGEERVYLTIHFTGYPDPVIFQAFEGREDIELTGAVMPIKSD